MTVTVRLGSPGDVDAAATVYVRSNLARRQGVWRNRASRIKQVSARLRDPVSWFLVADDGRRLVAMASMRRLSRTGGISTGRTLPAFRAVWEMSSAGQVWVVEEAEGSATDPRIDRDRSVPTDPWAQEPDGMNRFRYPTALEQRQLVLGGQKSGWSFS